MVEEKLLEGEGRVQRDVKQANLLVRNVLSVLVDLMRPHLTAFSNVFHCQGAEVDLIKIDHLYLVLTRLRLTELAILAILGTAASARASP